MAGAMEASLPYHEPGITIILVLASFLLFLNAVNAVLDKLLYCGLLGQVLVGIAWGTPGAKWLSSSVEEAVVQLGYLGLLLLVYEGWFTFPPGPYCNPLFRNRQEITSALLHQPRPSPQSQLSNVMQVDYIPRSHHSRPICYSRPVLP